MIYGFAGKMCSGKDTFFDYLVKNGFLESEQFAFADKVKKIAVDLFKVDVIRKDDRARRVLQQVGASMRKIEGTVWINYVLDNIQSNYSKNKNYGITDVRHLNEADSIIENGGRVLLLLGSDEIRKERLFIRDNIKVDDNTWIEWAAHPSEAEVDQIHEKYKNNPNMLIIDQLSNNHKENFELLINSLKEKQWL